MSDFEPANAHESDDCSLGCPHPDHYYDGDEWLDVYVSGVDFTTDELNDLARRVAGGRITWGQVIREMSRKSGPVVL